MERAGIRVVETAVGDRYVLEALEAGGFTMGGEQSGHVVFTDLATTGDGILTGLVLADVVQRSGRTLAELAEEAMTRLPQVLVNVRVAGSAVAAAASLAPEVAAAEAELGATGRVLVRPSGTEPIVRVMVEAAGHDEAERVARDLAAALADQAHH
jgi:phosphoglucosamine mutase